MKLSLFEYNEGTFSEKDVYQMNLHQTTQPQAIMAFQFKSDWMKFLKQQQKYFYFTVSYFSLFTIFIENTLLIIFAFLIETTDNLVPSKNKALLFFQLT